MKNTHSGYSGYTFSFFTQGTGPDNPKKLYFLGLKKAESDKRAMENLNDEIVYCTDILPCCIPEEEYNKLKAACS